MKKILSLVLTLALLATMCVFGGTSVSAAGTQWNGEAATAFSGGGDGTAANPYQIGTAGELKLFANIVNGQGGQTQDATLCGILTADITLNVGDVSGCNGTKAVGWYDWTPIGTGSEYLGTFNGGGHTISGVYVNTTAEKVGFFGTIATGAVVSNLGVVNSYISGDNTVGGVVGYINYNFEGAIATLTGCYNAGTVSGNNNIGGVCGYLRNGKISGCYNTGTVSGNDSIGGIFGGYFMYNVTACYNIGTVSGTSKVGGVVGYENTFSDESCFYLDTCAAAGTTLNNKCVAKTADEMKTQAFIDLLNANGGDFTYYIGKFPLQSWQPDPNIYGTAVTYKVAPVYTVTIPAEVTLGGTVTVEAESVVIEQGKQLEIALTGTSGTENAFTVSNGKTATLTYQVTDSTSNTILLGGTVLTVNPADSASGSTALNFSNPTNTVIYSGKYTGTVTFTVSVTDAI